MSVEEDDGFSRIVVGHRASSESFAGFYNSGLTLIETVDEARPGIAYKVSSPHLEHTLTRDNVIHDAGYERVMQRVGELVAGPLCDAVLQRLRAGLAGEPGVDLEGLTLALTRHAAAGHLARRGDAVVARSPAGRELTWKQLDGSHEDRAVYVTRHRSHLTDVLEQRGRTVVAEHAAATTSALLPLGLGPNLELVRVDERLCLPVAPGQAPDPSQQRLAEVTRRLLAAEGAKVGPVVYGSFAYPGSSVADRVAVAMAAMDEPAPVAEAVQLGRGFFSRARTLVLNAAHPTVESLVRLAGREPELAAYLLVKHFFLGHHLDEALDTRLLELGLKARWQRSTT